MRASIYILVEVESAYNNFIDIGEGKKLMINNSIDDVETINRVGKVIDSPSGMNCNPGDLLLFHHNICRQSWAKGSLRESNFCVRGNVYYVPATEVMMIQKVGEEDWTALDPFVFIEPVEAGTIEYPNGLKVKEENYNGKKHLQGILAYPNKSVEDLGAKKGDMVWFQQDSEHEYKIKGKLYYKMRTSDILAIQ